MQYDSYNFCRYYRSHITIVRRFNLLLSVIKDELSRLEISIPGAWGRIVRGDELLFFCGKLKKSQLNLGRLKVFI